MPFAGYEDFDACVAANGDKDDPKAYCAAVMRAAEKLALRSARAKLEEQHKYDPDQERDESGKWTGGGGEGQAADSVDGYRQLTTTRDSEIPAIRTDLVAALEEMGPGDTYEAARVLGLQADLKSFARVNREWTQGASTEAKERIAAILTSKTGVRELTLYSAYSSSGSSSTFERWLDTEITLYRAGGFSDSFMSFTPSERAARDASGVGAGTRLMRVQAAPRQWLGSGMTGAGEVYLSPATLREGARKFDPDQPRDSSGRWGSGGDGSTSTATPPSERAARALATHKPATAAKQRAGDAQQRAVARALGGASTPDYEPVDVVVTDRSGRTVGIEVKTWVDQTNDKVTMHPDSLRRKTSWARRARARLATIVVDLRDRFGGPYSGNRYYVARGVGSFRLGGLTPVRSLGEARARLLGGER